MIRRKLLLLLGFREDETKMASVRWKRFRTHLSREMFSFEWIPIKLPYGSDSSNAAVKAIREFTVLREARRRARQMAEGRDAGRKTIVLASIPTLDPLYVGAMLRRTCETDMELVLEVRDIYMRDELFEYNSVRRRLEILKEGLLIRYVDRFIFLTEEIKKRYCAYYPRLPKIRDGVVITNGYDPAEYGVCPPAAARSDSLDIGYFGSFYGSRNPELLFRAMTLLREDLPESSRIRVHIWGEPGGYPLNEKIAEYGLREAVIPHGVRSHEDIIREYAGTGVNLIITHTAGRGRQTRTDASGGPSSYALPGKLFEYVGAARPIWAITDDRILRDFIGRHKLGYLSVHTAASIADTLRTIVRDHARAGVLPEIGRVADFEIGPLTRQLEQFLADGECRHVP